MAIIETVIQDTPEFTWVAITDTVDRSVRTDQIRWKAGSEQFNSDQQRQRLQAALVTFEANYTNWASLSNAQKDAANRLGQRAIAAMIRQMLQELDSPGV